MQQTLPILGERERAAPKPKKARAYFQIMEQAQTYVENEKPKCESPEDVDKITRPLFQDETQECFYVIILDTKHQAKGARMITRGLADRSQIHPREVFRPAIVDNASRIILVHNHPSGDPTPSRQDISATNELVKAGEIIGISVLDHVVIGEKAERQPTGRLSFREENLLNK